MDTMPDALMEFAVGEDCPSELEMDRLKQLLEEQVLPGIGRRRKVLSICTRRSNLRTNVASVGLWFDTRSSSDEQLTAVLAETHLLKPGQNIALLMSAHGIRIAVEEIWERTKKKHNRVTFDDKIRVSVMNGAIETEVKGRYRVPPNIRFTYTALEKISLKSPGSVPPLAIEASNRLDARLLRIVRIPIALIVGILSPIFGGIVFFAVPRIANAVAPEVQGLGGALASYWPTEILTPRALPWLLGKFKFTWSELIVNERGVQTMGTFMPEVRQPKVSIKGPSSVVLQEELVPVKVKYRIDTRDLRDPRFQWSGAATGSEEETTVTFFSEGRYEVNATVRDADQLSASDRIVIIVSVNPRRPEHRP